MGIDRQPERVLTQTDLLKMYPFFGPNSLCLDTLRVCLNLDGTVGRRAIASWVVPERFCDEHFADFDNVRGLKLLPGHFWVEALGQALGGLVATRYPEQFVRILPTFQRATAEYVEAGFPGNRVDLCVELTKTRVDKGRMTMYGKGAVVFNDRVLTTVRPIKVRVLRLDVAIRALQGLRDKHQKEVDIPASFENFPKYFNRKYAWRDFNK